MENYSGVGCVIGGDPMRVEARTVRDVIEAMGLDGNYTALADGSPVDLDSELWDEAFVSLSMPVKGGC